MGCFSWIFANSDPARPRNLRIGRKGHLYCPDDTIITEPEYEGYGKFQDEDVYDLVADWNREYLSRNPQFMLAPSTAYTMYDAKGRLIHAITSIYEDNSIPAISIPVEWKKWYKVYANLSLSREDVVRQMREMEDREGTTPYFEYRNIGIDIACGNERNAALPFPIKICSKKTGLDYRTLPPSQNDPRQGS